MSHSDAIVYVVDDDRSVLVALARLLRANGFEVLTFDAPHVFMERHDPTVPGCVILDLSMPGLNGLQLQQMLATAGEPLPIIFLTGQADVPASVKAMKQGEVDFLTKPVEREALLIAVRAALERDRAVRLADREVTEIRRRLQRLTPREYEVLGHVISGKLNKQTAAEIGSAEKTVKVHRARVMEKMQVESVAELVLLVQRVGINPAPYEKSQSRAGSWD